jgi:hypothetical protein
MIENNHTRIARDFEKNFLTMAEEAKTELEQQFPDYYKKMYMYQELTKLIEEWKAGIKSKTNIAADAIKELDIGDLMSKICAIGRGINTREYYRPILEELDRKDETKLKLT